ncbi:MAG TPA: 3-hydroxyacyl-CoA dehydrogenase NAD-binding domain-containing protein [Nitrospiria bacterium]|nr:3-hydroxyacyl-CoA dehydrogenase NAD-binding domain-containing protein [Nitrospiria bacterium]
MTPEKNIRISVTDRGLCHIEIDVPGKTVNLISTRLLTELAEAVDSIQTDSRIKGIIFLSRKADHFIGGAEIDVQRFVNNLDTTLAFIKQGRDVFQKIASLPIPTLAAIHGACFGGGLELALACGYRLASDHRKTRLGLPEVMLGIFPGWGGITRLPRLIGLSAALDLLLTGKQLDAKRAERIGLIDRVVTSKEIPTQADSLMLEILSRGVSFQRKIQSVRMRSQKKFLTRFLNQTLIGRGLVFHQARKNVMRLTRGRYPAPLKIIDVVRRGIGVPLEGSLELEQEGLRTLVGEETTQNLIHIFSLRMHAGKLPKEITPTDHVPSIRKVGILGAGVMGAGIAQWMLQQEISVRLRDVNEEAIAKGIKTINEAFDKQVSRRKMRREEKEDRMRLLSATTGYTGFSTCDLVIEAVAERMEIKQRVIRDLQEAAGVSAIFATNTSSLSITAMAQAAKQPDRVLGLHFFNPVAQMPLIEVVKGERTSDETLAAGAAFVKRIGKTPLIVSDSPGFLVNRILMAYGNEAGLLLEEGATVDRVDRVMEAFGMPMGPFTMMDVVGLDIAHHTAETIRTALRLDPTEQSRIEDRLFEAGRFGKKTGQGLYRYEGREKRGNPELDTMLAAVRKERAITLRPMITDQEITDRLVMIMVNTAAWCLEKGVVQEAGDVDLGLIMGAGFPPFRGGLLKYCDKIGILRVKEMLDRYSQSAGPRFSPARMITDLARQGKGFY